MANSVKISDIASSAGVSTATVSYVINGKAEGLGITPVTRERVLEAIRQTGYRPNRAAREMAFGQQSADPLPATPAPDLATILAAAGYSLVPVASVNELPQMTGIGLVGVLYRQKETSPLEGHASSWPGAQAAAPGTKTEIPEITPSTLAPEPVAVPVQAPMEDAADTAATTEEVPVVAQSSVVTAVLGGTETRETNLVVPPVDADDPEASVTKENSPGTDGAGLPAVATPQALQAGTSPSTLVTEPVVAATPEHDHLNSSCPSCPSMLNPFGDTGEKDSNIDRQDVQDRIPISIPVTELPAAEPFLPVAPVISVSIPEPVAFVVPEPESEPATVEPVIDTSPTQAPVVEPVVPEIFPEPVSVVVEPLPTEMSVVEPSPVPEPTEPIAVVPATDADACGEQGRTTCGEPSRTIPAASVTGEDPTGPNGAGLPEVATPQAVQAGTSPSTLPPEPVPVDPATEPISAATPEPDLPNSSCSSCPSMLKPSGDTGENDLNIDRQDVQDRIPVSDPTPEPVPAPEPIPNPVVAAPVVEPEPITTAIPEPAAAMATPPSTTEQPNNPTTVLPPEPVTAAIPDTAIVPEEAIKAPEAASEPDPVVAEEPESEAENNEKSPV